MEKKLRWGILGTASIAQTAFIPGVQSSRHCIVQAIASRQPHKAAETAEKFDIPASYGSYEELLRDPEVDAVYIPLPNHLHREWTLKAAQAGKHVLCEKPAALNAAEAEEMVKACREAGIIFAEAFMYRHHPKHRRIREIVESGEIGLIRGIHGCFTYNDIKDTTNVRYQKHMGGGSIYDVGCYPISAARMILGEEPVAASVHAFFSPEHEIDLMASGLLEFPADVALTFQCGMSASPHCMLEVQGSEGRIELPLAFGWEHDEEPPQLIVYAGDTRREERLGVFNSFALEADAFADAVLRDEMMPFGPEDAVSNMKAIEACMQAAREKMRIVIGSAQS
ncbi:gfo/Idh/MocA family oxidoreductase [Paenibacillus sp. HJL G12]|uniref:Gfo/Idh/MocA family oxidoreductase n=1 Tax=Paenibacillus dendrobii TaxID=2691084 RepID=A0A7X3IH66_9BACL|nr:Gfo/Idh/MocA family oxidoreductase [Paenibacillus dendrobii]MWV43406.1 gfo/Idh/MocA family oxidoreductase [Paenibacillus dendrobii]